MMREECARFSPLFLSLYLSLFPLPLPSPSPSPSGGDGAGVMALYGAESIAVYEGNVFRGQGEIQNIVGNRLSAGGVRMQLSSNIEAQFTSTGQLLIVVTGESSMPVRRSERQRQRESPSAKRQSWRDYSKARPCLGAAFAWGEAWRYRKITIEWCTLD